MGRQLRFFLEVGGEFRCRADGGGDSHCEQCEREDYVWGSYSFHAEIGRSPEVVLLEELSVRGVGDHDGAERADEGPEQDAEGDEVLGIDLKGYEIADEGANQRADEAADRKGTPSAHSGGRCAQACRASEAEAVDVSELVTPEVLHLNAAYRQGYPT